MIPLWNFNSKALHASVATYKSFLVCKWPVRINSWSSFSDLWPTNLLLYVLHNWLSWSGWGSSKLATYSTYWTSAKIRFVWKWVGLGSVIMWPLDRSTVPCKAELECVIVGEELRYWHSLKQTSSLYSFRIISVLEGD